MRKILFAIVALTLCFSYTFAQHSTSQQTVPYSSSVRHGVLPNGLTYYIQHASMKKDVAEFRMVQRTGSLVEEDNEKGMAHFLEHMLFKGTKHFPGTSVLDFLRRHGVAFGADTNALTSFEDTRYTLSGVPINHEMMVDSCLMILHDWCADATIDAKELEAERDVIVEEWRQKTTASASINLEMSLYEGTRYKDRLPIGDMEVIRTCTAEQMRSFYKKWYQPQQQCIIVTGYIDVDKMEKAIQRTFGDLKRGNTILPDYPLAKVQKEPRICVVSDKNEKMGIVTLISRHPNPSPGEPITVGKLKQAHMKTIALRALGGRLGKLNEKTPSIFSCSNNNQDFPYSSKANIDQIQLRSAPKYLKENLKLVLMELKKAKQQGLTRSELEAGYPNVNYEVEHTDEDTTVIDFSKSNISIHSSWAPSYLANDLINHFLQGTLPVTEKANSILNQYYQSHVSGDMVNATMKELFPEEDNFILVKMPDMEGVPTISQQDILDIINEVKNTEITDNQNDTPSKADTRDEQKAEQAPLQIKAGKIKKQKLLKDIGYMEYTLSNGIRVLMNAEPDTTSMAFQLRAVVGGGTSLLEDDEVLYGDLIRGISNNLRPNYRYPGYTHPVNDVSMALSPHNICYLMEYFPEITSLIGAEGMTEEEMEQMREELDRDEDKKYMEGIEKCLRNFYIQLTTKEIDHESFDKDMTLLRQETMLPKNRTDVAQAKRMTFDLASSTRRVEVTEEVLDGISPEKMAEVQARLHSNYRGMTVVITTYKEPKKFLPYIEKYIASLPAQKKAFNVIDRQGIHLKDHDDKYTAYIDNPTPIAMVQMSIEQEEGFHYDAQQVAHSEALENVLNQLLINNIRFKHNDVYSIQAQHVTRQYPSALHGYPIVFTCNPEKAETIIADVKEVLKGMAEGDLITQPLLNSYINAKTTKAANETPRNKHSIDYVFESICNDGIVLDPADLTPMKTVTIYSLKQFAQQLLGKGHIYEFIIRTE